MRSGVSDDQRALTVDDATLPVIDLGGLFSGDPADKANIVAELGRAARSLGFFYITGHGVPQAPIYAIIAASRQFHGMPRPYKMRWWSGFTTHHRGYVPLEENGSNFPKSINMNEAQDMSSEARAGHPDCLAKWRMTGPNIWPDLPGWKDTVAGYCDAVFCLSLRLLDALALELGVETEELMRHIAYPTSQLPLLRYVPNDLPATKDIVGIYRLRPKPWSRFDTFQTSFDTSEGSGDRFTIINIC